MKEKNLSEVIQSSFMTCAPGVKPSVDMTIRVEDFISDRFLKYTLTSGPETVELLQTLFEEITGRMIKKS